MQALALEIDEVLAKIDRAWAAASTGATASEIEDLWSKVEADLDRVLHLDAATWTAAGLEDRLAEALESLESDARVVLSDAGRAHRDAERLLPLLRVRVQALRQIVRATAGRPRRDEVPLLLNELRDIEHDFDGKNGTMRLGGWNRASHVPMVEVVYADVVRARVEAVLKKSYGVDRVDGANALAVFRIWRALESARTRVIELSEHVPNTMRDAERDLSGETARLDQLLNTWVGGTDATVFPAIVARMSLEFMDEVDDARLAATDLEPIPDAVVVRLIVAATRFRRAAARTAARAERKSVPGACAKEVARFGRSVRRIVADRADRVLKRRLIAVFGRRLSRVWDQLVFWLVIAALILIVVDHYVDEVDGEPMPWYVWGDTAICCVLLLDFFVRLTLTPRRWSYFFRHALTGFLAFLPFGLFANFEKVSFFRARWFIELGTTLKFVRAAQPLIAFFRLILFMSRAADRVVEALAWLLNKKIIFFSESVKGEALPTLLKRARDLDGWIRRSATRILADLSTDDRKESAELRLRLVAARVKRGVVGDGLGRGREAGEHAPTELDAEEVIKTLRELDETNIHDAVTWDVAQRLIASMRVCRLPVIRGLPVVRYILGTRGEHDSAGIISRLAHVAADVLDLAQRVIHWFADLYGTITGAQFLDRLGLQIVKTTGRPARRMILFGAIAGLAVLLVKLLRLGFLNTVADAFFRFLSTPVLVLGFLCLVPFMIGMWLRRIAGAAADFHDRVAEGQFLALTEVTKEELADQHLKILAERVVLPEARLTRSLEGRDAAALIERVQTEGVRHPFMAHDPTEREQGSLGALVDWNRVDFMLLYYRDFIDGAFFHKTDTKIANMMLGNLTLENVRRDRLHWTKKDQRRLEKLDIGRVGGGLTGPYVWFNFITTSIAQQTARLIIEYNEHCIPLDEWALAADDDRRAFEDWFLHRSNKAEGKRAGAVVVGEVVPRIADDHCSYRTTEFTALHFLGLGSRRDEAIARRFGDRVAKLLALDRENLVRGIFGTFPMHELPPETRTFNPYEFYRRYFARGRVFGFPFVFFWLTLRSVKRLFGWILRLVRETIDPDSVRTQPLTNRCGFEVARRKIYRMRRPIVLESMRERAAFDVEYLGLSLPGQRATVATGDQAAADLRLLNASEREWEEFRVLKSLRERQIRMLSGVLSEAFAVNPTSPLRALFHDAADATADNSRRRGESLRAVVTAFVVDHAGISSLVEARRELIVLLERISHAPPPERTRRRLVRRDRVLENAVRAAWPIIAPGRIGDDHLRAAFVRAVRADRTRVRARVLRIAEFLRGGGTDISVHVAHVLEAVASQPSTWTEQMVAIRTVQSLAVIDVTGYETVVRRLGNYVIEDDDTPIFDSGKGRL